MAEKVLQSFVKSFIVFLKTQIEKQSLDSDGLESVEIAIQCLQEAFELSSDEENNINIAGSSSSVASIPRKLDVVDLFDVYKYICVEKNPNKKALSVIIHNDGNRLMNEGNFQEALRQYYKSIKYDPTNPDFYFNRAAAHIQVGQYENAVLDCKMALVYNPEYGKAHGRMGVAYAYLNEFDEAMEAYHRALKFEPCNQDYRNNLRFVAERAAASGSQNINAPNQFLPNLAHVFATGVSVTGQPGNNVPGGSNIANKSVENVPGNMKVFMGDMKRDPVITTALQTITENPEGLLDMSHQVAAAMKTDNPDFMPNVQDSLNCAGANNFQQPDGGSDRNADKQPPPNDGAPPPPKDGAMPPPKDGAPPPPNDGAPPPPKDGAMPTPNDGAPPPPKDGAMPPPKDGAMPTPKDGAPPPSYDGAPPPPNDGAPPPPYDGAMPPPNDGAPPPPKDGAPPPPKDGAPPPPNDGAPPPPNDGAPPPPNDGAPPSQK